MSVSIAMPADAVQHPRLMYRSPISLRWCFLALATILVLLGNLGGYRPLTSHEVLVAQSAREMKQRGNWVIPTYYGEPRLRKPPLAYWMVMTSYGLFGVSDFSARLPSAIAGILLVGTVAAIACQWNGTKVGWRAGFIQLTSVYFLMQARLAEADITLALTVALCLALYARACSVVPTLAMQGLFGSCLALSVLAKGPVGPAIVVVTLLSHVLLGAGTKGLRILRSPFGWGAFLLLAGAWPVAVVWQLPHAPAIWWKETLGRFAEDPNGVQRYWGYYLWAALWLTLPWTGLWIHRLCWLWSQRLQWWKHRNTSSSAQRNLLLACWLFAPMVLLSLSSGKQEHYLIPALAPCCLLAAQSLDRLLRTVRTLRGLQRKSVQWCAAGALVCLIVAVHTFVLPTVHGRREVATWMGKQTTAWQSGPPVALGHTVQWLAFYADGPLERMDSIEELLEHRTGEPRWILTTHQVALQLQSQGTILAWIHAPNDSKLSGKKHVVLVRFV